MNTRWVSFSVFVGLALATLLAGAGGARGQSEPGEAVTRHAPVAAPAAAYVPGTVLVRLAEGAAAADAPFAELSLAVERYRPELDVYALAVAAGREEATAALLREQPGVLWAEPDYLMSLHETARTPNDTYYNQRQWYLRRIAAESAWNTTTGADTVIVAVIDSGADLDHPDLAGNLVTGYDVVDGDNSPEDFDGHGTNVAGLIGAVGNNGAGVAGVAWDVSIMPIKVGTYSIPASNVAVALRWAADHGADVANMSLGGSLPSAVVREAVDYAYGRGVLLVASSGNGYLDGNPANYPAAFDHVLAVAATDDQDGHASYSTSGAFVDVSAPGGDPLWNGDPVFEHWIFGLYRGNTYAFYAGTSQAAPQVSGLAALLLSADPSLTADEAAGVITSTALDVQGPGKDFFSGHGRIDVAAAVAEVSNPFTPVDASFLPVVSRAAGP